MLVINRLLNYSLPWELPNIYLFTGNASVKKNGAIVMGRGAARQVRDTYRGIDFAFGQRLKDDPHTYLLWERLDGEVFSTQWLGWFKVKRCWNEKADLDLISLATYQLKRAAQMRPEFIFHMNFPGIGNGGLEFDDVMDIVKLLPRNVWLYK